MKRPLIIAGLILFFCQAHAAGGIRFPFPGDPGLVANSSRLLTFSHPLSGICYLTYHPVFGCSVKAKFSPGQDTVVINGVPILLTNQSENADTYAWYINGTYVSSAMDITITPLPGVNEILLIASNNTCADSSLSFVIRNDSQIPGGLPILKKQFNIQGMSFEPFCIGGDKENGYLLAGNYFSPSDDTYILKTTCFIRVDKNGCIVWSKSMPEGRAEVIQSIIATSDSGFLVSSFPYQPRTANYPDSLFIFKLNKQGNIAWAHAYQSGSSVTNYFSSMYETPDKGFVLEIGSFFRGSNASFLSVLKIDQLGRFVWGRKLGKEDNATYNVGGLIEKNGFIYASGSIYEGVSPNQLLRSFLVQLDAQTGQVTWTKQNAIQSVLSFTDLHFYKNGILLNSFDNSSFHHLLYTDYNGNVLSGHIVNNPYGSSNGSQNIVVNNDNSIYFHQSSGLNGGIPKDIIALFDSNLQISWQKDFYSQDLSFEGWYQLVPAPANGMAALGSGLGKDSLRSLTFLRIDPSGSVCNAGPTALSLLPANASLIPMSWDINADLYFDVPDIPRNFAAISVISRLYCPRYSTGCDLLKLEDPGFICNPGDTATIVLHSDPSCPDPVNWIYDSLNISVLSNGASGLVASFKREGSYLIRVEKNGCDLVTDSILIIVGNRAGVHLPKDTTLCKGNVLVLDAGYGYENYQWQDGSHQQSIRISVPGIYWVRLTGKKGCISTDTVMVSEAGLPVNFLPADTVICSYELLTIKSLQLFKSYQWSTAETTPFIKVKDQGEYILEVIDKNGCTGSDTIRVGVKECPNSIFFPNAFTPNKDGLNDQFRPVMSGNLVKYHFIVYDRWGQRVFETIDPGKGWNGKNNGKEQGSGSYIWICEYQFGGEKENRTKGSCLLIR